jgi:nucleotide-binding universal stress UspA family protein
MRKAEVETYLTTAAQMFSSRNIRVKKALLEGAAAERIVAHAAAQESDLIVLSSHGQSGVSGWNVSSVAQKVITRANRSILLMRAFQQGPVAQDEVKPLRLKRLLVPLDGSKRAEGILPVACKLAAAHRATLWLVHVATFTSLVRPFQEISEEMSLDKITSQYHEAADSYLQQTGSQLECMTKSAVIEGETVIGTLNRFVEEEAIDLMLLSAHGRANAHQSYGSVATNALFHSPVSLFIFQDLQPYEIEPTRTEAASGEYRNPTTRQTASHAQPTFWTP